MNITNKGRYTTFALTASLALPGTALGEDLINLSFTPSTQSVEVGEQVFIGMVATPAGSTSGSFAGIDAILQWDPTVLHYEGFEVAPSTWFLADFLPDPDGLNDDLLDGDGLFTLFAPLGTEMTAPVGGTTPVVFQFTALRAISDSEMQFIQSFGSYSDTEVLKLGNVDVTGDLTATANVTVGGGATACVGDLDGSGSIDIVDMLALLGLWGTDPNGPPDFNGDGDVGIDDFLMLLGAWGGCL